MKKLLTAIAVIGFAAITNAASIAWNFAAIPMIDEDDEGGNFDGMLVYFVDSAGYSAFSAALAGGEDLSGLYMASSTVGADEAGFLTGAGSSISYDNFGDKVSAYAFIVDDTGTKYTQITASGIVGDAAVASGMLELATEEELTFIGDTSTWASIGATPVVPDPGDAPEPTSGLLLMLGVAGLALKRKRA